MSSRSCQPLDQARLPGQVVLVMQGGGAPGCYQAGVYQALHEAGIEPDWVIGTSIGAINGAIIAGNQVADRLERLREFWARLESRFLGPWSKLMPLVAGVPGYFHPNPAIAWGLDAEVGVEQASLYSVDPLKNLLPNFVDFNLINSGRPRFTLRLVGVRSGQMRYFDNKAETIGLAHVLGSSAIPPSFPAVRIEGEAHWDGGIYSNTPIEVVFDDNPCRDSVVFTVQIWHSRGSEPESIAQAFMRQKDILFASRSRSHIARQAQIHQLRHIVRELIEMLPEERKNSTRVRELADCGCAAIMHLVEINAEPLDGETNARDYDFSQSSIQARWAAGYADTRRMIARRPWDEPVDPGIGVAMYASDGATSIKLADSPLTCDCSSRPSPIAVD
jgi:NTE family protein